MEDTLLEAARRLHHTLKARGLSLSGAESFTGGFVAHLITALPGASEFFHCALVLYSPQAKERLLGIKREFLQEHGVVSEATAGQMARRVRRLAGTALAYSSTGNAGPTAQEGKPVGLVYLGVDGPGGTVVRELHLKGQRGEIIQQATLELLRMLLQEASG
jgi:PncC family amidohydrolase